MFPSHDRSGTVTKSNLARAERDKSKAIARGDTLQDVTGKERAILKDIEKVLTYIAEKDDLNSYRAPLESLLGRILKKAKESENDGGNLEKKVQDYIKSSIS